MVIPAGYDLLGVSLTTDDEGYVTWVNLTLWPQKCQILGEKQTLLQAGNAVEDSDWSQNPSKVWQSLLATGPMSIIISFMRNTEKM